MLSPRLEIPYERKQRQTHSPLKRPCGTVLSLKLTPTPLIAVNP
jgi:hypothetical protein